MKIKLNKIKSSKYNSVIFITVASLFFGIYIGNKDLFSFFKGHYYLLRAPMILSSFFEKNNLENIYLNITFKDLKILNEKREIALKKGYLQRTSNDFISAKINHKGIEEDCKIRIKGDLEDHWKNSKWSLRVKIKGGRTVLGMSEFSLQSPVVRENTQEWLFLKTIESQKLLGVKYEFVNLIINGEKMGIYALEEHFTKHLIERCERREGGIVGFDDHKIADVFWGDSRNQDINELYSKLPIKFYNNSDNIELADQYNTAARLLEGLQFGEIEPEKVFNSRELGKFLAICHIWGAQHNLQVNNIKFYFNPIIAQLEPIAFDACPNLSNMSPYQYFSKDYPEHSFWIKRALKSPNISYHFIKYLDLFSRTSFIENLKINFRTKDEKYRKLITRDLFFRDSDEIFSNFSSLLFRDQWQVISDRCARIRRELSLQDLALVRANFDDRKISISIQNSTLQPLEIIGFQIDQKFSSIKDYFGTIEGENLPVVSNYNTIILHPKSENINNSRINFLIEDKKKLPKMYVIARLWGLDSKPISIPVQKQKVINFLHLPKFAHTQSNLYNFEFINEEKDNVFVIESGNYKIDSDIVIPSSSTLILKPGTTLEFAQEACLICFGSIITNATAESPIKFTDQKGGWGGILVYNTEKPTNFRYCTFENINGAGYSSNPKGIDRSGWNLTGALSIYHSAIKIENCNFTNINAEDALNIFRGNFQLLDCNFSNTYSDAFDGDFVFGKVDGCKFWEINGDGIDFSGSEANVTGCTFSSITDKAISVGEESHTKINSVYIEKVGFGVVSKDQSVVELNDSTILKASISAISAYQKKPEFGPAQISVSNTTALDCEKIYLIQVGSTGVYDKKVLPIESFSSHTLYKN